MAGIGRLEQNGRRLRLEDGRQHFLDIDVVVVGPS
jgi:7,8-dihydro-6-hydroxymethylpterin-pyrophosphokinase